MSGLLLHASIASKAFSFKFETAAADTLAPQRISETSSMRRENTPAKYISIKRFLHGSLAPFVALDDRCCEPHALELGHLKRHLVRCGCKVSLVMTCPVCLAIRCALVALSTDKTIRLFFEKGV